MWQIGTHLVFRGLAPCSPCGGVAIRSVAGDVLATVSCTELQKAWSRHPVEERLAQHSYRLLRPDGLQLPTFKSVPFRLERVPSFWDMVWPHAELTCVMALAPPGPLPSGGEPLDKVRQRWGDEQNFTWEGIYCAEDVGTAGTLWTVRQSPCVGGYARFIWEGDMLVALSMKSCRVCRIPRAVLDSYAILREEGANGQLELDPRTPPFLWASLLGAKVLSAEVCVENCSSWVGRSAAAEKDMFHALMEARRSVSEMDSVANRRSETLRALVHDCGALVAAAPTMLEERIAREKARIFWSAGRLRAGRDTSTPPARLFAVLMGFSAEPSKRRRL